MAAKERAARVAKSRQGRTLSQTENVQKPVLVEDKKVGFSQVVGN